MDFLYTHFGCPPPFWLSLAFGLADAFPALAGSALRGRLAVRSRRTGTGLCVLGLGFMTMELIPLTSRFKNGPSL